MDTYSWQEFCALYYETAKEMASATLGKTIKTLGGVNPKVDLDYVVDTAVLEALQKVYNKYDQTRGAKLKTFLSTVVHNEVVDALEKENKTVCDCDSDPYVDRDIDEIASAIPSSALATLKWKLRSAIEKLSPSDQTIISLYMEKGDAYAAIAAGVLGISQNYVCVRKSRIIDRLPALMGVTRDQYLDLYEEESAVNYCVMEESRPVELPKPSGLAKSKMRFRVASYQSASVGNLFDSFMAVDEPARNPIYPAFDLDRVLNLMVARLARK